jgi:peroxiredoxin
MTLTVGTPAPDFTLNDHDGNAVTLSSLRGQSVVLNFYPFAFSGLCTNEICEIRDDNAAFDGATVLAITCDPPFTLKAWADAERYPHRMLSDFWPHGQVASAYGAFDDAMGCANRCTFVIDADGTIVAALETENKGVTRTRDDYVTAMKELG